ncbi:type II CAAX endopeptidase family protein [Neobacillus sp. PS3-34]|uniref:CPBP family intramembrane glutamic endopeptidase n=1 Tax=Neobacillus sp. PS3-34 TaxID=3070678 RepID=UPI0027E2156D|nr:type II CAAX endopeptidase family protein [Neobacillus sp. PS3-34]WML48868.1 type II CAAX endopeptidase family protein [Neobacillus sp. PS3-34]
MKKLLLGIIGFLLLDLYFNEAVIGFSNMYAQLAAILLFFPLAHYTAKIAGLGGLKGMGIKFHRGWKKNFLYSFLIGFLFWAILYSLRNYAGVIEVTGVKKPLDALMPFLEAFAGYLLGSLINDLIVRGYVFRLLKGRISIGWVFTISILIYALDDYWHEPFSASNFIFSCILGLSLTYAFYKTGSIWADTGLHFGLNMAFALLYGLSKKAGAGIFLIRETGKSNGIAEMLPYFIPFVMFLFIIVVIRYYTKADSSGEVSISSNETKSF